MFGEFEEVTYLLSSGGDEMSDFGGDSIISFSFNGISQPSECFFSEEAWDISECVP